MPDNPTSETANNPNDKIPKSSPVGIKEQPQSSDKTTANDENEEKPKETIEQPKNNKWTVSDKINLCMVVFTAGLFMVTGYSTCLTRKAIIASDTTNTNIFNKMQVFAYASKQYANATDSLVKEQRFNDSVIRRTDSIKFSNGTIYADKKFRNDSENYVNNFINENKSRKIQDSISKEYIKSQIGVLNETINEFKSEHTPFLECRNFRVKINATNTLPDFSFDIYNLGIAVQKIDTGIYVLLTAPYTYTNDSFIIPQDIKMGNIVNRYISNEAPYPVSGKGGFFTTPELLNKITKGSDYIFLSGIIIYTNEGITNKREYHFLIRFDNLIPGHYDIIKNDNFDYK